MQAPQHANGHLPALTPSTGGGRGWWSYLFIGAAAPLVLATYLIMEATGHPLEVTLMALIAVFGVLIGISDARHRIIPNRLTLMLTTTTVLAFVFHAIAGNAETLLPAAAGAVGLALFYALLYLLKGTSPGDVKLAFPLGAALGATLSLTPFLVATLIALLLSVPHALINRRRGDNHYPYGPYLIAGTLIALVLNLILKPGIA